MTERNAMDANEKLVCDTWERVLVCDGSYRHYAKGTILINWANHSFYKFKAEHWDEAASFTRVRLEEIRQVEEEIALLEYASFSADLSGFKPLALGRILVREQAALAELKKGLKG
jgi:hypothetical protein